MKWKYLLVCATAFAGVRSGSAQTWIPVNAPSLDWLPPAYSTNGDKIVAAARGLGIYISTNSGLDWTLTDAPKTNWTSIACSADASKIFASISKNQAIFPYNNVPGQIYISTNSGVTWNISSAPLENWSSVASSSDGITLLAAGGDSFIPGFLYTSTNSGATWSTTANLEGRWGLVTLSGDARRMFAEADYGQVFLSTNFGANWDLTDAPGNFTIANDGQRLLSLGSGGLYISTNSGMSSTILNAGFRSTFLSASEDGLGLVSSQISGSLFTSADGGTNWAMVPNSGGNWQSIAASPNGAWRIAMEGFGRTWISYAPDSAPFFVVQPIASTNVYEDTAVTLKAGALGSAPIAYQWQCNGTNLSDDARMAGCATAELTISNLQVSDTGIYSLAATNGFGATNSEPVALTVNADTEKPSVVIIAPAGKVKWAASTFQAYGSVSDNSQVAGVWYKLNSDPWTLAATVDGWHSWYANFWPTDDANTLSVYAVDQVGNVSPTNTVNFTAILQSPMFVRISGQGKVRPNYDQKTLNIGSRYKMTATAANGYIFAGWSGDVQAGTRDLSFTMQGDLSVEADFIPNPFPTVRGLYEGDVFTFVVPTNSSPQPGVLRVEVERSGAFAGKIELQNTVYHFSGKFSADGAAHFTVPKKGTSAFDITMQLDLNGGNALRVQFSGSNLAGEVVADRKLK